MRKNIAVIFGGKSTEHDISIITAIQILNNLDKMAYNIIPIYINKKSLWYTGKDLLDIKFYRNINYKKLKEIAILPSCSLLYKKTISGFKPYVNIDCCVLALHGINGEDGTIQGLLELSGIPYTSSGVMGSSLGMDKLAMKLMFKSLDLPVLPYVKISKSEYKNKNFTSENILSYINLPVVVKPDKLGSSIGISVCHTIEDFDFALEVAFTFDNKVVVEKAVTEIKEVNVSAMGYGENVEVSITEEPLNWEAFLSFSDKYLSSTTSGLDQKTRKMPAEISEEQRIFIENSAQTVFKEFDCKGVVRIDYIIDLSTNNIYINEINTIPGSFAYYLWEQQGYTFKTLLNKIIDLAILGKEEASRCVTDFSSKVLLGGTDGSKIKK